jgi:hypothetical protein
LTIDWYITHKISHSGIAAQTGTASAMPASMAAEITAPIHATAA